MKYIGWYILVLAALVGNYTEAQAQKIVVSAPSRVQAGENFRLSYTINTREVQEFRCGDVPDGLEVIAGPYTSSQSSYQMVNGHTSSSSSVTITYTLYANKTGSYNISPARAVVGNHKLVSQPVRIVVAGHAARNSNGAPKMHNDDDNEPGVRESGSAISGRDLFIKVSASKKRVHEQEPILLTYKVYTQVELTQLDGKMPDLKGFHTQELPLPRQKTFHTEEVNGRPYKCVTWSQYVMYPQMTGKLEIPSITFKGIVVQQNRNVDPMEAFFNGGSGYVEVHKNIQAPGITLQVDPLPARPANFSGGVGTFDVSAALDKEKVKAGEPINLRVVVGGVGNLKLLKQPIVDFPKDFDKYDAKVIDKTRLTAHGVEGNVIYDFLAVPRNQGNYTIPAIEFTYYDTKLNAYKTIKTQSFNLNVEKGDGSNGSGSDNSAQQGKDIRAIKQGKASLRDDGDIFYGSMGYWMSLLFPFMVFVVLLIVFHRRAIVNADIDRRRFNVANKIATKRLRLANQLMLKGKQSEFYDEVLKALWGYVSYKLNMPVEQLSRDNIRERLANLQVADSIIDKFTQALDECEFERYAPGDAAGNMSKTFESAMTAIMEIETSIRNVRKGHRKASDLGTAMRMFFLLMAMMPFVSLSIGAVTKQDADAEYQKGNYQQAVRDYEELLKTGASAEVYYNLGNAYYRMGNLTRSIINYERAHQLAPADDDISFNLQFVRNKTVDRIMPASEMFFVTWYRSLVNGMSIDGWAACSIVFVVVALLLILLYIFASRMMVRKVGFFGGITFFVFFLLSTLFAHQQKRMLSNHRGAIVVVPTVNVKKTPSAQGADQYVIHEGTRVDITDKTMKGWRGVKLADGREGWIETKQIEEI